MQSNQIPTPILQDEIVIARPITHADFEPLYLAASDPLIWEQHPERERHKREVFQKFFDGALESPGAFVVVEKSSGEVIGSSRYYFLTERELARYSISTQLDNSVSIGYTFLIRRCWGGVFNGALKRLMIDHAFTQFNTIAFQIGAKNIRSQKAVEKIGARKLDVDDDLPNDRGGSDPHVFYVLTRDTWMERPR